MSARRESLLARPAGHRPVGFACVLIVALAAGIGLARAADANGPSVDVRPAFDVQVADEGRALVVSREPDWSFSLTRREGPAPEAHVEADGLELVLRADGALEFTLGGGLAAKPARDGQTIVATTLAGRRVLRLGPLRAADAAGRDVSGRLVLHFAPGAAPVLEIVLDTTDSIRPVDVRLRLTEIEDPPQDSAAQTDSVLVVPPNDQCPGAEVIPPAGPFPYFTAITADITGATTTGDPPAPSCQASVQRSIWYKFVPSVTALYTFSTCADEPTATTVDDTVLAVYTSSTSACGGAFTQVAPGCDDDSCNLESFQSVLADQPLTAGTTYFILVHQWGGAPTPTPGNTAVQVKVSQVLPPANDTCAGAIALQNNRVVSGTNNLASGNYSLSGTTCFQGSGNTTAGCPASGRDTVWSFTAPAAGSYSFRVQTTDPAGSGNPVLYTSPTCPAAPAAITCAPPVLAANRNVQTAQSLAADEVWCQPLSAGQKVYVFVDECAPSSTGGDYTLEVNTCAAEVEPNTSPATSTPIGSACPMEGAVNPAADIDFFSLGSLPVDTRVFAIVDTVQGVSTDADLRVTSAADTLEYDDLNNAPPWGTAGPNIAGRKLTGTPSFLRLNQLGATSTIEPYRLQVVLQPPGADAFQSSATAETNDAGNDTLAGANAAGNLYFSGTVSSNTDLDLYRFCAAAGDLISLGLDTDPKRDLTPINSAVFLFDSAGAQLLGADDTGSTSSNTSGAGSLTSLNPNSPAEGATWRARYTGPYYAGVYPSNSGTLLGDYLYSIGLNCRNGTMQSDDLGVSVSDGPDPLAPGGNVTWTIVAANTGANIALDAVMTDVLPAGTTFVSLTGTGTGGNWTCSVPSVGAGGTVSCTNPCFTNGASFTFTLIAKLNGCPGNVTFGNTASLAGKTSDANAVNNSSTTTTTVSGPGSCNDNNVCTTGDACAGTVCAGTFADADGDTHCDALDCAPLDAGVFAVPGEVTGVLFAPDKVTLSWSSAAPGAGPATVHDVVRGRIPGGLPVGSGPETCLANSQGAASKTDTAVPLAGQVFWYLVRGQNVCGSGTYGQRSNGAPRVSSACP